MCSYTVRRQLRRHTQTGSNRIAGPPDMNPVEIITGPKGTETPTLVTLASDMPTHQTRFLAVEAPIFGLGMDEERR